jgi:hypothetical protein
LYRVNGFFCHADTWQAAFERLAAGGGAVLMDLRSFSPENDGCVHELRHLVSHVPLGRCVFVVDGRTRSDFLRGTFEDAFEAMGPGSPNQDLTPDSVVLHDSRIRAARTTLFARLASAACVPAASQAAFTARPAMRSS